MVKKIIIFTDGACSKNPGPGGWAAILNHDTEYETISGWEFETTSNRMELLAVIKAIKKAKEQRYTKVIINTDSAYVANAINKNWLLKWKRNGWMTSTNSQVKNSDLWKKLYTILKGVNVEFKKVKGHDGNTFNELADKYAKAAVNIAKSLADDREG